VVRRLKDDGVFRCLRTHVTLLTFVNPNMTYREVSIRRDAEQQQTLHAPEFSIEPVIMEAPESDVQSLDQYHRHYLLMEFFFLEF
jgi:hypothetical protein